MTKPVYQAINRHAPKHSVIVFVASKTLAQSTAIDIVNFTKIEENQNRLNDIQIEEIQDKILKETLLHGVGFLHEGLNTNDCSLVQTLFTSGLIQVCIVSHRMLYSLTIDAQLVIIMDTQYYLSNKHTYDDCSINDILQMMSRAYDLVKQNRTKVILMCLSSKKDFYKRFLCEPLPIESHLDLCVHDCLNTEICTKNVKNKQDAVDYLTWTLLYRRIIKNPNYYNLSDSSHRSISNYLSELVENALSDLDRTRVR